MNRNILSVALLTAATLIATACETDLTSINVNPNNPTSAPPSSLFTNATVAGVFRVNEPFNSLSMTSLFAQHIAQVQYVEEDRGHIRTESIDLLWEGVYTEELKDFEQIILAGKGTQRPNIVGPAVVMQSWVYHNLTDLFGDIPYTAALKGDAGGSFSPKYDMQKDIYYGLLKSLTDASAGMTTGDGDFAAADPIYHGDMTGWKKFANSLRARLALRMQKADAPKADAELRAAFAAAGGVISSNADNAQMAWPGDGLYDNPWSTNFATRDDHRVSKTLLDTMNALLDPRVKVYAQPTKADPTIYVGLQNGLDNILVVPFFNTTSRPGIIFYPGATVYGSFGTAAGKTTPSLLLTYAEVAFIRAEAAERGLGGQTGAAAHYQAGVRASIEQWGGTVAEADAYLARTGVRYTAGASGLRQIGLQKWIALYAQGAEAWSEWRRTGNPASIKAGPKAYPDVPEVPRRIPYASNEQSVNAASLAAAIARQGADTYRTRVWWDKP